MKTVCKLNQCAGCKACVDICKKNAISIVDSLSAVNASIDENLCVNCGACEKVCPNNSVLQMKRPQEWYATLDRVSDITLGDSWGSELDVEEQKKGISLILCQTEKGKELLENTKIELRNVDLNKAIEANHQLSRPSEMPTERKIFFRNIDKGFYRAIARCHPKMYFIRRLKYILHKAKNFGRGLQKQ